MTALEPCVFGLSITVTRVWTRVRAYVGTLADYRKRSWRRRLPDLRESFGERYPWAVAMGGPILTLTELRPFSRRYGDPHLGHCASASRFHDGSASMTLAKLRSGWARWLTMDRIEFGQEGGWLATQADFPDMLRFVAAVAEASEFESVATWIPRALPSEEAIGLLERRLKSSALGEASNTAGALGRIEGEASTILLRERLRLLRAHRDYLADNGWMNYVAYEACICIAGLIRHGRTEEVAPVVAELGAHPSSQVRDALTFNIARAGEGAG